MHLILLAISVVIVDQFSKYLTVRTLVEGQSIPIIKGFFHITFIYNKGAAFGILEEKQWIFILVALALLLTIYYLRKHIATEDRRTQFGIALLVGGAVGNLIDRIRINKVIDYFDFLIWPVFNIADIAICLGVGIVLWMNIRQDLRKK